MNLAENIAYLRKQKKISQEELAEIMSVSRQTISKWETGQINPELEKLIKLSNVFSCSLNELIIQELDDPEQVYSPVRMVDVPDFDMARYVIISPQCESDVQNYLLDWGKRSGLLEQDPNAQIIGWDFPYVPSELKNRFNLRGYVAAWILPDGFYTNVPGVEYAHQNQAKYAVISIRDPFVAPFERIPTAYKKIIQYLDGSGFKGKPMENALSCFEKTYEKDGITWMDVFILPDSLSRENVYSDIVS